MFYNIYFLLSNIEVLGFAAANIYLPPKISIQNFMSWWKTFWMTILKIGLKDKINVIYFEIM